MTTVATPVTPTTPVLICDTNGELFVSSGQSVYFTQSATQVDTTAAIMFELKRGERHPVWDLPAGMKIYAWAVSVDSTVSFTPRNGDPV